MPDSPNSAELCRYDYDPLDRQCGCTIVQQPAFQRFHCKSRLATELQAAARRSLFQHDDQLLAQHTHLGARTTTLLLASDQQRSVLNALDAARLHPLAYSPYGHRPAHAGLLSLLGFNGERPDPVTGHYHLGNGYRQFNPVLMRFNSPDGWSPFGEGGLNAYGYCGGDSVNRSDPTGHAFKWFRSFWKGVKNKFFGRVPSKSRPTNTPNSVIPGTPISNIASSETVTIDFNELTIQAGIDRRTAGNKLSTIYKSNPTPDKIKDFGYPERTRNLLINRKTQSLREHIQPAILKEDLEKFKKFKALEHNDNGILSALYTEQNSEHRWTFYASYLSQTEKNPNPATLRIIRRGVS